MRGELLVVLILAAVFRADAQADVCTAKQVQAYCLRSTKAEGLDLSILSGSPCESALAPETTGYFVDKCSLAQADLNQCLIVASSDPVGVMACVDAPTCLDQMNRVLVAQCSECLAKRQNLELPVLLAPQYRDTSKQAQQKDALACTAADIEMFCLVSLVPHCVFMF
jgi:hypothetical protein